MDPQAFSEWLTSLSPSERTSALTLIYFNLTIKTRELFLPEWTARKDLPILDMLQGMNEIHHTLSSQLIAYGTDGKYAHSLEALGLMLVEIASKYRIGGFLESAVEFTQARIPPLKS
jgi:hypothetical protein